MSVEPVKRQVCARCKREVNPVHARYLWVGWGERGACQYGKTGNQLFGRKREQSEAVFCGPCGDEVRHFLTDFKAGAHAWHGCDSFERGVVRE